MKRGNEETDYYAYLKLLVYCCVALFVCKHSFICMQMSLSFTVYINETTAVGLLFT